MMNAYLKIRIEGSRLCSVLRTANKRNLMMWKNIVKTVYRRTTYHVYDSIV